MDTKHNDFTGINTITTGINSKLGLRDLAVKYIKFGVDYESFINETPWCPLFEELGVTTVSQANSIKQEAWLSAMALLIYKGGTVK